MRRTTVFADHEALGTLETLDHRRFATVRPGHVDGLTLVP
jgi:hypothetical protein